MKTLYFVQPGMRPAGSTYHVLGPDERTVVQILRSRPDGVEVARPARSVTAIPKPKPNLEPHVPSVMRSTMLSPYHNPRIGLFGTEKRCVRCRKVLALKLFAPGTGTFDLSDACQPCEKAKGPHRSNGAVANANPFRRGKRIAAR